MPFDIGLESRHVGLDLGYMAISLVFLATLPKIRYEGLASLDNQYITSIIINNTDKLRDNGRAKARYRGL